MTEMGSRPDPPEFMKAFGPIGLPELSDRDAACLVLPDLDYDSQVAAIHHVLRGHREADQELDQEIAEIRTFAQRTSGFRNEQAVSEWVDRLHTSVYQDAAQSMAAVGMLAPLVESVFYQAFQGIRQHPQANVDVLTEHVRWRKPSEHQWDCHFAWSNGRPNKNLVEGIMQLAEAVGLAPYLPKELKLTLQALFKYRNKMFHCGFEWPVDERDGFAKRIANAGWPVNWFGKAEKGNEPWLYYMSDAFIQCCLAMVDQIICAIGAYSKARLYPSSPTPDVVV